ncbi:type II toxin-antitoxin system RelE/ParE family toxin [Bradyrhizobium sp. BWC-3-1]|uniref:type II toxin-antitoxin system RelE/ParE family toxin n=1 Tax=Bradyrhizobium sp. BWC-3-1 TaxID=3080012 RepID=UPI00293EBCE3|nr:type II toxin-antitoxin system RelE/ParE family toxin [Bradyrhizobium sp. BWC-3-1]WOH55296.1 type II toxin-antitoxin system RelE/ParE family toxin [Bradyrhizobium sp. BWC-3-1]
MAYDIRQWPASVKKEIADLPVAAEAAVLVMLREMRSSGPMPEEYKVKPLRSHLHGIKQVNMKINREQIRVLFMTTGPQIVLLHVFKKTSPQIETRGYDKALDRKAQVDEMMRSGYEPPAFH